MSIPETSPEFETLATNVALNLRPEIIKLFRVFGVDKALMSRSPDEVEPAADWLFSTLLGAGVFQALRIAIRKRTLPALAAATLENEMREAAPELMRQVARFFASVEYQSGRAARAKTSPKISEDRQ